VKLRRVAALKKSRNLTLTPKQSAKKDVKNEGRTDYVVENKGA
jgi:hypothetical protein